MELVNNAKVLYTLFLCVGYGVVCGAVATLVSLSLFRTLRHPVARAVADISLYFWSALGLFLLSLSLTDGRPRFWLFAGTAIGFFGWRRLLSRPFCALMRRVFRRFSRLRNAIVQLFAPSVSKTRKKIKKCEIFFKKLLKFKEGILYNVSK